MTGFGNKRIIAAIAAIALINGLQHCVSPVLSEIHHHFSSVDISFVQMLITAPCLIAMIVALITGWLAMRVDQRTLFLTAAAVSGVTGVLPYLADNFWILFFSRMAYGLSLGIAVSLVTALVADYFEGEQRVRVMGMQGASVGATMMIVTTVCGVIGKGDFRRAYFINLLAFVAFAIIAVCLPKKEKKKRRGMQRIQLNHRVFVMAAFMFVESFFVITFTTNISMHLSGSLKGDTAVAGLLTGIFSVSQVIFGFLLNHIVKVSRKYTLPGAMFGLALGYLVIAVFPGNTVMLVLGAVLCGYSQGVYFPKAMVEVTTVVPLASAPMASSVMTVAICGSQLISPVIINIAAKLVFGETTTTNAYMIACIGTVISGICAVIWKMKDKNC